MAERFAKCAPLSLQRMRGTDGGPSWGDVGAALGAEQLAVRVWRLRPGQATHRHRHVRQEELYQLVEGGPQHLLVDDVSLTVQDGEWVRLPPGSVRRIVNDTERDASWLVIGAPAAADDVPVE